MLKLSTVPARPFDPHKRAATPAMRSLIGEVLSQLAGYEKFHHIRKRKRSDRAQQSYDTIVEAVVCDVVHRELEQLGGTLHLPQSNQVLRKKSRYKGKALSKVLPDVLKVMSAEETGFLCIQTGKRGYTVQVGTSKEVVPGKQTTLRAGSKLLTRIQRFGISLGDIRRSQSEEVIQLRGIKPRSDKVGPLIEYEDTEETEALRASLRSINNWLEQADIECTLDWTCPVLVPLQVLV